MQLMQKAQCHTVPFQESNSLGKQTLRTTRIPEAWLSLNLARTHNDSGDALAMHGFLTEYIYIYLEWIAFTAFPKPEFQSTKI